MAIERGVDDIDVDELGIEDNSKEVVVSIAPEESAMFDEIEDGDEAILDDGTMVFGMDEMGDMDEPVAFDANLAEEMDSQDLGRIYSDCMGDIKDDKSSRKEWEDQYKEGLEFLGMKFEDRTEPFDGASGVVHPLLAESVTQFQAQASIVGS